MASVICRGLRGNPMLRVAIGSPLRWCGATPQCVVGAGFGRPPWTTTPVARSAVNSPPLEGWRAARRSRTTRRGGHYPAAIASQIPPRDVEDAVPYRTRETRVVEGSDPYKRCAPLHAQRPCCTQQGRCLLTISYSTSTISGITKPSLSVTGASGSFIRRRIEMPNGTETKNVQKSAIGFAI